ncbi:hypothetical protein HPB50_010489 [Hyalomma asiaticum]|uniref:Uncharacterized protein n=1 Tax=Hyalomma asiaticum TaxID=266040 RepID=A0ACB7SD51_HYAAI|nr:hypothetical protein HPB50_010489 [Hyalomma asiaticum]
MSDVAIKGCGHDVLDVLDSPKSDATSHGSDSSVHSLQPLTPSSSQRQPRKVYGRRPMEIVQPVLPSHLRSPGVYGSKMVHPARCHSKRVVLVVRLAELSQMRDPGHVVRILDICSHKLMLTDLDYNRMRKAQLSCIAGAPDRDANEGRQWRGS